MPRRQSSGYASMRLVALVLLCSALSLSGSTLTAASAPHPVIGINQPRVQESYGRLPLYFIQNQGQLDDKVKYYEKTNRHCIYFTQDGVHFAFSQTKTESKLAAAHNREKSPAASSRLSHNRTQVSPPELFHLRPVGMHPEVEITAFEPADGKVNYLCGNDPRLWRTNIPTYRAVVYREAYPGIDLKFYGAGRQLEYDIILKPGADPKQVKFRLGGIKDLAITEEGDLLVRLPNGSSVRQKKPQIYQEIMGAKVSREGKFKLAKDEGPGVYGFEVASYDRTTPLVIDPIMLIYSTYLGGNGYDACNAMAVDSSGNAYVTGCTYSSTFPHTSSAYHTSLNGASDAFVTKISPAGDALVYSTFLGGSGGEEGYGIAVDSQGCAYVTGYTDSSDFPTLNPLQASRSGDTDSFVTKLSASGSALVYSTYLGYAYDDSGNAIAVDGLGNAYIAGETYSPDALANVLVSKINANGSLGYKISLGGTGNDVGRGIAVDNTGNAYVTGYTKSNDFPISTNAIQTRLRGISNAFLAKIDGAGNRVYSTFLGGSGSDEGNSIALDNAGKAYLTGITRSPDFPLKNQLQAALQGGSDAFVTKIDLANTAVVYSTYLGRSYDDEGTGIAVDQTGAAYLTGWTAVPVPPDAPAMFPTDAFVARVNPAGNNLDFYYLLGGSDNDWGNGIALDQAGNIYVTGETSSVDFPISYALQASLNGAANGFISKISLNKVTRGWNEDFESYTAGIFPGSFWVNSGNTAVTVDNVHSVSGSKSLKLYGSVGGCWGALAHRKLIIKPPLFIECQVYNGSESLSGCHPQYGMVALNSGPSWTYSGRTLIVFSKDGKIKGGDLQGDLQVSGNVLDSYLPATWYKIKMKYEIIGSSNVRISYWINDKYKGSYNLSSLTYENDLSYISISANEGSAWFDDIKVYEVSQKAINTSLMLLLLN